jgi:hypothetical protein
MKIYSPATIVALLSGAAAISACDVTESPSHSLVGSWNRTESTEVLDRYVFRPDGTCTHAIAPVPGHPGSGSSIDATYTAGIVDLTIERVDPDDGRRLRWSYTYYANDSLFSPGALMAIDDHDGIVGTWSNRTQLDVIADDGTETTESSSELTLRVKPDGTVSVTDEVLGSAPFEATGSYQEIWPEVYRMTFPQPDGGTRWLTLMLVDDNALMTTFYRH